MVNVLAREEDAVIMCSFDVFLGTHFSLVKLVMIYIGHFYNCLTSLQYGLVLSFSQRLRSCRTWH